MKKLPLLLFLIVPVIVHAQRLRMMLPVGHTAKVFFAAFSADGEKILTSADDNVAKLWDAQTGMLLANFIHRKSFLKITGISFNTDGKKAMVIFSQESKVKAEAGFNETAANIYSTETGQRLYSLSYSRSIVRKAHFSPDGKYIISSHENGTFNLWDAATGDFIKTFLEDNSNRLILADGAFNSTGDKFITWDNNAGIARVYQVPSCQVLFTLDGQIGNTSVAAFSPDGGTIVTCSVNGKSKLWSANNGTGLFTLDKHTSTINEASFSPDGRRLLTIADGDKLARVWDLVSGAQLYTLDNPSSSIHSGVFSADGKQILITNINKAAIMDAVNGRLLYAMDGHHAQVVAANFSHDQQKIITASADGTAKIWNAHTGKELMSLVGNTRPFNMATFSADGKQLLTIAADNSPKTWNSETGAFEKILHLKNTAQSLNNINCARFNPDGKTIAAATNDGQLIVFNNYTGEDTISLKAHTKSILSVSYNPDGSRLLTTSADSTVKVWDTKTYHLLATLRGSKAEVYCAAYSNNGQTIISGAKDGTVTKWSSSTFEAVKSWKAHPDCIASVKFGPGDKKIITASWDKTACIWDASTDKLLITLAAHVGPLTGACFSPDGKQVATAGSDNLCFLWDPENPKPLQVLDGHANSISSVEYNADGSKILTASLDNSCKMWAIKENRLLYSFYVVEENGFIIQTPSRYYYSTPDAARLFHYVTNDLKIISFDQLDVRYNRPDKVLEEIGCRDTALINAYRQAYLKRIKKLEIDTSSFNDLFSVPEIDFPDRAQIAYDQKNEILSIRIKGEDANARLSKLNVWVNESPLFTQKGISLAGNSKKTIDTTITITLSTGENAIETSVLNENGVESYRMPLVVNYSPGHPKEEKLYFVGIGSERFADSGYNLAYCAKDIRDLALKFKAKTTSAIIIDTLFNENVSSENIRKLKELLSATTENDKVIISFSGHGLLNKNYDYFLSTYKVDFNRPENNGLPYEELESLVDGIRARKKLVMIDACHSGELDKDEAKQNESAKAAVVALNKGVKGVRPVKQNGSAINMKSSFELMQALFVNVSRGTGATIISASTGTQFALERNDLTNGVFTYSILELLDMKKEVSVNYLKKYVSNRVSELTNGLQRPTTRNETKKTDWMVIKQ